MATLAEKYPLAVERLIQQKRPAVAEILKHFNKASEVNAALGVTGFHLYLTSDTRPSNPIQSAAHWWLEAKKLAEAKADAPSPDADGTSILVLIKDPAKARKVLDFLGCEEVDI